MGQPAYRLENTSICFWSSPTISWFVSMRAVIPAISSTRPRVLPAAPEMPEAAPSIAPEMLEMEPAISSMAVFSRRARSLKDSIECPM